MARTVNINRHLTSEEIDRVPLPSSLRCKDCGQDKGPASFSNRHLREYRYWKAHNRGCAPTAKKTTARCRKCTGEPVHELKCEGQCGLWKSLDEYSKTQRHRGDNWCKQCVLWKSSLEPGTSTVAAPNTDLAPDENDAVQPLSVWAEGTYDLEGEGEDAEGNASVSWNFGAMSESLIENGVAASDAASMASGYVPPPFRSMAGTSTITASNSVTATAPPSNAGGGNVAPHLRGLHGASIATATPSMTATTSPFNAGYVPPHLRTIAAATTTATPSATATASSSNGGADYVPPHMRGMRLPAAGPQSGSTNASLGARGDRMSTMSSVSNPWEDRSTATSSAGAVGRPAIAFTGWDSAGNAYQQYRLPSESSTATEHSARPPIRSSGIAPAPAPRPVAATTQPTRTNGNWARPAGARNGALRYIPLPPPTTQPSRRPNTGYDSDGSIDEM